MTSNEPVPSTGAETSRSATAWARIQLPAIVWGLGIGLAGGSGFDGHFGLPFWLGIVLIVIGLPWVILDRRRHP